jgi:mannose-1-phosphate guanylyltransferase/mannose-6-phosphate isomerase
MLLQTVAHLSGVEHTAPVLICDEEPRFIEAEQMRIGGFEHSGVILEPEGRNTTAPAIALASLQAVNNAVEGEAPILLVLAADHVIQNITAFESAVQHALTFAQNNQLVTFGIAPAAPETGYGYIRSGEKSGNAFTVSEFVEKPNLATAQKYLLSGNYYWNSGMFFKASRYLEELAKFSPEILDICKQAIVAQEQDLEFVRVNKAIFEACTDDSVDYVVMEKTKILWLF